MRGRYIDTFRDEAAELLQELEEALLTLEDDQGSAAAIDLVFRILHTLKGSGAMAGFPRTAALAHEVETVFDLLRSGHLTLNRELISVALSALDQLRATVSAELSDTHPDSAALHALNQRLQALLPDTREAREAAPASAVAPPPQRLFLLRFRPGPDLFLRGIDPAALLQLLTELGPLRVAARQQAIPPLGSLDPESCHLFWDVLLASAVEANAIHDIFIFTERDSDFALRELPLPTGLPASDTLTLLGERLLDGGDLPFEQLVRLLRDGLNDSATIDPAARQRDNDGPGSRGELQRNNSSLRVQSERLDRLVNLIGELVTIQARLSQTVAGRKDAVMDGLAEEIERLTWELRDEVLFIRMLPVGATFGRLRRLVRDLTGELGKDVEFATSGDDTELDKTVIERLQEPLMHLLRNCLDHGIEPPEVRLRLGKPPRGTIHIAAAHSGPHVVLTVSDDGQGLDRDKLLRRALALGLVEHERQPSEREIQQFIFAPGLSTAEQISSISGRGVGMDAVRRAIEGLRGSIEVASSTGRGTTFTIKLPLTLAIIDGLLVKAGSEHYVVPLSLVEECIELTRAVLPLAHDRQLLNLRGELVPFVRLRQEFAITGPQPRIEQVVITDCDGQRLGLVVDKVIGSHQTVIKPMGRLAETSPCFTGATILGSGQVALILDLPHLLARLSCAELQATGT